MDQEKPPKIEKQKVDKCSPPSSQKIIPDYLLKKLQEKHEKEGKPPEQIKKDRQNRVLSKKLRQQRSSQLDPSDS
jgi:hypothetical protein